MTQKNNVPVTDRIARERADQIYKHGRTPEHDLANNDRGQLLFAVDSLIRKRFNAESASYTLPTAWNKEIWAKMLAKPFKERLVIAAALLAAEVDRIELEEQQNPTSL